MNPIPFRKMLKGKVIIAFLIACIALVLAWAVSNVAFREMLTTVQTISEPNEKLGIVNNLYRRITLLEQFQRSLSRDNPQETYARFKKESKLVWRSLDSLKVLYAGDDLQTGRIKTMKLLLRKREKQFADYLAVREALVNNQVLDGEVSNLNDLLLDNSKLPDSTTVWKSENRYTTTVIHPQKEETPAGLLRRIFGRRKTPQQDTTPQKIVNEELSITIDTIASGRQDTLFETVDSVLVNLQKKQKQQTRQFVLREKQLSDAGHVLVSQMLTLLDQVEKEVLKQAKANHARTGVLVKNSSRQINLIIIAFLLVTAFLLYFILTDISRNNKYRQLLEQANQEANYHSMAKQRFLSNMSHEIRTPLQAIMGYAELARYQNETEKKNIDAIYKSSGHLLQIVNEVLDYSNIVSGKFTFNNSVFGLEGVIDEVISVMKVQAEKKSLSMIKNYELDEDLYVEGDPFRLRQIIYNLLGNAIKFTEKGTIELTLSGKENGGIMHLDIRVQDSGIGISAEDTKHIFGEFERAENNSTNGLPGTGLGLSIVKTLVNNLGGRIYVSSIEDEGSCFTVFLPFIKAERPGHNPVAEKPETKQPYSGTVWMVDDDRFILQLCSSIFEKHHIHYKCFNDPADVLNEIPDENLSCVLLDMRMPGMNGAELCTLMRKKLPAGIHIFALTAQALPWEQENVMRQGFDGLLMKPFREAELIELIHSTNEEAIIENDELLVPDFESLRSMTFGDISKITLILKQFSSDCHADCIQLRTSMFHEDLDESLLILHRIAGRTAQIGSLDLAADFRLAEMELNESGMFGRELNEKIMVLMRRLMKLAGIVSDRAESQVL